MNSIATRFACSTGWISDQFQQMTPWQPSFQSKFTDIEILPWILGFLVHDSFDSFESYWKNAAKFAGIGSGDHARLLSKLTSASAQDRLDDLIMALRKLTGFRAVVRTGAVRISTRNDFSRGFLPPHSIEAGKAMETLFALRRVPDGSTIEIGRSLASYMVFLTAHPLRDGNGRSARMLFAADCVVRDARTAACEILGLILLHRRRGNLFHLAARCARAGDFNMLASCYDQALGPGVEKLADGLRALERAIQEDSPALRSVARDIHDFLGFELKSTA